MAKSYKDYAAEVREKGGKPAANVRGHIGKKCFNKTRSKLDYKAYLMREDLKEDNLFIEAMKQKDVVNQVTVAKSWLYDLPEVRAKVQRDKVENMWVAEYSGLMS